MNNNINVNVSGPIQPTSQYKTVVLKGNHSFASQVTEPNMKYVIKHDFDLGDASVTIPEGCLLEFDGGSLRNGTLVGQNTDIITSNKQIFDNIILSGGWINRRFYVEFFLSNFTDDCSDILNSIIETIPNDSELCCNHNIIISKPVNINKNIDLRFDCNVTLNINGAFVLNGIKLKKLFFNNIIGDGYSGNTKGLKLINASFNNIEINTIKNCKYGISFNEESANEQSLGQNIFKYALINGCDKGIYFKGSEGTIIWSGDNANAVWAEGNEFFGGFIAKCNTGIHLENNIKCGNTIFIGAVDCIESGESAYDIIDNTNSSSYSQKNIYISNFLRPTKVQMRVRDTIIGTEYGIQSYAAFKSHDGINIDDGTNQSIVQAGNVEIANTNGGYIDFKNDKTEDRDIRLMNNGNNLNITSTALDGTVKLSIGSHASIESEANAGKVKIKNNNLRGTDVGLSLIPPTGNRGVAVENNILKVQNAGNASVTEGNTTKTIGFSFKPSTNDYILFITPSWKTLYNITGRSVNGFDVSFDVAAPANASFDWIMMGKGMV